MDDGVADKTRLRAVEEWCDKARALLAMSSAPDKSDAEALEQRPLYGTGKDLYSKAVEMAKAVPSGALPAQLARLKVPGAPFLAAPAKSGGSEGGKSEAEKIQAFTEKNLQHIVNKADALAKVQREILGEIRQRQALDTRLQSLPATVTGADVTEAQEIATLRATAAKLIAEADEAAKMDPAERAIEAFSQRRDAIALAVADRLLRRDALSEQERLVKAAPDELPTALDATRTPLVALLKLDAITETQLGDAARLLADLQQAWQTADAEARSLSQLRTLYETDARALDAQIAALDIKSIPSVPKDLKQRVDTILEKIKAARAVLAPKARPRSESETFPALFRVAEFEYRELVRAALTGSSDGARSRVKSQLGTLLAALQAKAAQLPSASGKGSYKDDIAGDVGKVTSGLNGSQQQRSTAAKLLADLTEQVESHRQQTGVDQQMYHQRWDTAAAAAPDLGAIDHCLAAYALRLSDLRKVLTAAAPVMLDVQQVQRIEQAAVDYPKTWGAADADAKLQVQADQVWARIQALDPDAIRAAARAPVQAELAKSVAAADAAWKATAIDRDMQRALTLAQALELRLQAVKGEPAFDANAAALQVIPAPQRQAAHDLCGATLLGQLGEPARTALGVQLAAHGPAIATLARQAFGGSPKVIEQVLRDCGAEGLSMLAQAFDGDDKAASRDALQGLIDKAGLGDKPAILARLVGPVPPAPARGAAVKSLADNFSGEPGEKALATLLGGCGLDTQPDLLAGVLTPPGLAGDGAALRQFADAFDGDAVAQGDMKRIVASGGLGTHPKALGPLVRRGGAGAMKKVGKAFAAPQDCQNLKGLLEGGGLGGKAGEAGHDHEHPDTLAQLLQDGLGGSGDQLKAYAKAFAGPAGQAKSKEMLGAFNEYGAGHAASREPGKAVGRLLNGPNLAGTPAERIGLLSTRFVPELQAIADPDQRKQAFRMAPHMVTQTAQRVPPTAAMQAGGYAEVTSSVSKRHRPESFSLDYAKTKGYQEQTMFPPGVDLGTLVDLALIEVNAGRVFGKTPTSVKQDRVTILVPPTNTPMTVEFGSVTDGGKKINHFGPRNDPPPGGPALTNGPPHPVETPNFSRTEMTAIFKSLGKPT